SALPAESEEFQAGSVTFRPYLLACVRQAALDRARSAGRAEPGRARHSGRAPASPPPPAPLAGLAPDGEVVLSSMEHHVARGALAALPERTRTALWLSDVEAMTPGEVGRILGTDPEMAAALAAEARVGVRSAQDSAHGHHEVRADCRFTVEHLGAYHTGTLDPKKGVLVRSHLDICPPCRMRLGELANAPATLAAAVPAAPLLGGEAQAHWLTSAADLHPADRLLPAGLAAAAPAWHFPAVLRPVRDHRSRRVAGVAGAAPVVARKVGRRAWPAVSSVTLIVAWLGVMLSLPQLMQPGTAPGPAGLALPAVQAYVPDFLPGAAKKGSKASQPKPPNGIGGGSELAAQFTSESDRSGAGGLASGEATPGVGLISTSTERSRAGGPRPSGPAPTPAPVTEILEAAPAVLTNVVAVVPLAVTMPSPTPAPAPESRPAEASKPKLESKPKPESRPKDDPTTARQESKKAKKESRKAEKESRKAEKESKKAEKDSGKAERKTQPVSRGKIVTA
ncbi:MAG TPA: zf-HC2 domain-containing protein, partial [Acidimicrobiia bacterium]|nr:zf-HC2 domain-containing protein [Acidimicrobiia bacterium]